MPNSPTAAHSLGMRVSLENVPGTFGRFTTAIGDAGGNLAGTSDFEVKGRLVYRTVHVHARDESHAQELKAAVDGLDGVTMLDSWDRTFDLHEGGKIEISPVVDVVDVDDLAMAYTPGVARVCMAIEGDHDLARRYTIKKNTVAIVTDATAVLGLGHISPEAAMPVMEGKELLFKSFGQVDAFPICLDTTNATEVIETVERIAPVFGGINLEDIAAPNAMIVEEALRERLSIPVFHDDQHGTAIVVLAGLLNALRVVGKHPQDTTVVISGIGAAGSAIGMMLVEAGFGDIIGVDRHGAIHAGQDDLNLVHQRFAAVTNRDAKSGSLAEALAGADVFVGVSKPDLLQPEDVASMAPDPIVFAMANPEPEIRPEAIAGVAAVVATGRSDFPNQINNVLAFPGVFRGALDCGASTVNEEMKYAAAEAIAAIVSDDELAADFIIPSPFDRRVASAVADAVADAARRTGVARI